MDVPGCDLSVKKEFVEVIILFHPLEKNMTMTLCIPTFFPEYRTPKPLVQRFLHACSVIHDFEASLQNRQPTSYCSPRLHCRLFPRFWIRSIVFSVMMYTVEWNTRTSGEVETCLS